MNARECEESEVYFTLPYSEEPLCEGGEQLLLTERNKFDYIKLIYEWYFGSHTQYIVNAFKSGFNKVFCIDKLELFTSEELEQKICGAASEEWSFMELESNIEAKNGYDRESQVYKDLLEVLIGFSKQERRQFLQFCTGTTRLPMGGWSALSPKFSVNKTSLEEYKKADNYLPTVTTCLNYLKLPEYTSLEVLKSKLLEAMYEGTNEFTLT